MKQWFACCVAALLLAACGNSGEGGSQDKSQTEGGAAAQDKSSGGGPGVVTIDGPAQQKAGIQVASVEPRSVPEYFAAAGQIVMNEERTSHIGTYTDGRITELHANVGDYVRQGMVLARMHSHDVHETRAAYETALQDVKRQETALAYQQQMRDRMLRLFALKSASRQEVDKAETDVHSAETDLANAHIAVNKEVAHLTDILHVPASSLPNINETTEQVPVVAPSAGVVVNRAITLGAVVEPGQEVYTITDLHTVWMMASVNEADIGKVHIGQSVRILTQAYPDQAFSGKVLRLGTELDAKTRTLQATIVIPNQEQKLRPAMFANAQVSQGQSRQSLFVPEDSVQDLNGGSIVFVRTKPNTFEPRVIEIAHRLHGEAEISSGLKPGDAVVEKGSFVVKSEMLKSQIGE